MDRDFQFELPAELIAQEPAARRTDSRMLLLRRGQGPAGDAGFTDLLRYLRPGDLLVLNESRVLPARLMTRRVPSGGQVEVLMISPAGDGATWLAMARPARRLGPGEKLEVQPGPLHPAADSAPVLEVLEKRTDGLIRIDGDRSLPEIAERWGHIPLPPYIRRGADEDAAQAESDRERYQTVYAKPDPSGAGSVAAPTAGLHFTPEVLAGIEARGVGLARVNLHVGPGTFQPPSDQQLSSGRLHREFFEMPAATWLAWRTTRERGGRVIPVGTTSLRVLETVAGLDLPGAPDVIREFGPTATDPDPVFTGRAEPKNDAWHIHGSTQLFIRPPQTVQAADGLLTNFHLPGSSLLMLVASLAGHEACAAAYEHAVHDRYRFYSYGDCMLILDDFGKGAGE